MANKKLLKFIVNSIIRLVSGATPLDPLRSRVESIQQYDISTDAMCMDIIRCHNKYLVAAKHAKQTKDDLVNDLVKKAAEDTAAKQQGSGKKTRQPGTKATATTAHAIDTYGVMYTEHIQDNVHLYVAYGIWMQRRTQMLERILFDAREKQFKDVETTMQTDKRRKQPRVPYQVIAQLTLKVRFMSFGEEQITEFIKMLSGEKGVQDLFSFDMVPTADDMSAANIDKTMCKIQELQRVYDRTENLVKKTVQQNKLDNAHKALANLQSSDNARRAKADAKLKAVAEATTTRTTHMKRPRTSTQSQTAPKRQRIEKSHSVWEKIPLDTWRKMSRVVAETLFVVPKHLRKRWTGTVHCVDGWYDKSWPIGTLREKPKTFPSTRTKLDPKPLKFVS